MALKEIDQPLNFVKYSDATYEYYCEAFPGSSAARSLPVWRVLRKTISSGDMVYAEGGEFEHAATNLATVAALTYTMGS